MRRKQRWPRLRYRLGTPPTSCRQCYAWGVNGGRCKACESFGASHPVGVCGTCCREVPLKQGACRLCHRQASLIAGPDNKVRLDLTVAARTGHQLFFDGMARAIRRRPPLTATTAGGQNPVAAPVLALVRQSWWQPALFELSPDLTPASSLRPPLDATLMDIMIKRADTLAALRGWNARTLGQVRRGLRIVASTHPPGEPILATTVDQLKCKSLTAQRTREVLADLGILVDDRVESLDVWLESHLVGLPEQIRSELDVWITTMRYGTPRRRPKARGTVTGYLRHILPFLTQCATRYHTLRQVTPDDVLDWLEDRPTRPNDATVLRDLFRILKQQRIVFANPTRAIKGGRHQPSIPIPLSAAQLAATRDALHSNVLLRVAVALAAIHALQPAKIRALGIADIDLANQRLRCDSDEHPLDEYTAVAITDYLALRRNRWPHTGNPHLLITRKTAHSRDPVSQYWLEHLFRQLPDGVTARRLREDRIIEEGITVGADPIHLAAVFSISPRTGQRYATAAAQTASLPEP